MGSRLRGEHDFLLENGETKSFVTRLFHAAKRFVDPFDIPTCLFRRDGEFPLPVGD